jgi:hypothetical protein
MNNRTQDLPELDDAVAGQLEELDIAHDRPLIIADADEVLFQFMAKFLEFLEANGYRFDWSSFALTGNIRDAKTDDVIESGIVRKLMPRFFSEHAANMDPVADAANVLARLSDRAQVVVLSNVPIEARPDRLACLKANGLDYPLIANTGAKGPVVSAMLRGNSIPAVFIDDIPHNHASVADFADHVLRLHFIAHPRLAKMLDKAAGAHHRAESWLDIENLIDSHFIAAGY